MKLIRKEIQGDIRDHAHSGVTTQVGFSEREEELIGMAKAILLCDLRISLYFEQNFLHERVWVRRCWGIASEANIGY